MGATTTTWGYEYDDVGRLKVVRKDGAITEEYAYDKNGNRTGRKTQGDAAALVGTYDDRTG